MKVILVGNGYSVMDNEMGKYIDSNFDLVNYKWKFHGIGFHYVSQVYLYISNFFLNFEPWEAALSHNSQSPADLYFALKKPYFA